MLVQLANHNKSMIAQLPHLNEYSVEHRAVACPAPSRMHNAKLPKQKDTQSTLCYN